MLGQTMGEMAYPQAKSSSYYPNSKGDISHPNCPMLVQNSLCNSLMSKIATYIKPMWQTLCRPTRCIELTVASFSSSYLPIVHIRILWFSEVLVLSRIVRLAHTYPNIMESISIYSHLKYSQQFYQLQYLLWIHDAIMLLHAFNLLCMYKQAVSCIAQQFTFVSSDIGVMKFIGH